MEFLLESLTTNEPSLRRGRQHSSTCRNQSVIISTKSSKRHRQVTDGTYCRSEALILGILCWVQISHQELGWTEVGFSCCLNSC